MFFYHREPAALIDWTLGQQAFNCCMILLFDAIEVRRVTTGAMKAEHAFVVFKELENNNVHKLASLAVGRISWGLTELHKIVTQPSLSGTGAQGRHTELQGPSGNEATYGTDPPDMIMGNTGMLLLEDPGLQAFVPETFTPFTWTKSGSQRGPLRQQDDRFPSGIDSVNEMKSEMSSDDFYSLRTPDDLQIGRKSMSRSTAPTDYATLLGDNAQPHSHTQPKPRSGLTSPNHTFSKLAREEHHERKSKQRQHQVESAHTLQMRSHKPISEATSMRNDGWAYETVPDPPSLSLIHI